MKRYVVMILLALTVLLSACGYRDYLEKYIEEHGTGRAISGSVLRGNAVSEGAASQKETVSGPVLSVSGSVNAAEYVDDRMQTADFWISKTYAADKAVKKETDIQSLHETFLEKLCGKTDSVYYDLEQYGDRIKGSELHMLMAQEDLIHSTCFQNGNKVSQKQMNTYLQNCGISSLADFNAVSYGILCVGVRVRALPTADRLFASLDKPGNRELLTVSSLPANEPILVLYTSQDRQWYFILSEICAGWVPVEQVALCRDKAAWQSARDKEEFLIVTGEKIVVQNPDIKDNTISYCFDMGTQLEIARGEEAEQYCEKNSIRDCYVVKMPVRGEDGSLSYAMLPIPLGKDVHAGYMEYTRRNILSQAMKYQGSLPGTAGQNDNQMAHNIFRCFGFRLPTDQSTLEQVPSLEGMDLSQMEESGKKAKVASIYPGTLLIGKAGPSVYLGCVDQRHFVLGEENGVVSVHSLSDFDSLTGVTG